MLVGLASVVPLSIVAGVGTRLPVGSPRRADAVGDRSTLAVAVHGRTVEATPSLVVTRVDGGDHGRRRVQLAVRGGPGGRLALAFDGALARSGGGSASTEGHPVDGVGRSLHVTVDLAGERIRSGPFESVFDGTVERPGDRLCPGVSSWLTLTWTVPPRSTGADARVAAGTIRVGVERDGCPGRQ